METPIATESHKAINMPLSCNYSITGDPSAEALVNDAHTMLISSIGQLISISEELEGSDISKRWIEAFHGSLRLLDIAQACTEKALTKLPVTDSEV
ncbi:hypothetical protein [Gilvimarinus sp. DA14]|uniref:hypothetical protein n=1 Tax=Gilvimarinus sp. DA14 TaxID=2956798 RepID=UPI0020B7A41F|nr:hypothetical protein [Gilvimarinus sp. DA14]UTF60271.1 hypothetical protein NHM04_00315 [Gilvimarinus sp. DA14]